PRPETGAGEDLLEPLTLGAAAGLPGRRPGRHLRVGRGVVGHAQTTFERVDDVGRGNEVAERRQVGERVEAEPLEELARRPVHHGLSRFRVAAYLLLVAAPPPRVEDRFDVAVAGARGCLRL